MTAVPNRLIVLVADDDENDAILIRRAFDATRNCAEVRTVPDGEEAIAYLLGEGRYADREAYPFPHVLILDHRMPRLSGLGVLCWLRTDPRFAQLPTVVFSLALTPAEADAIIRLRAASCTKPVAPYLTAATLADGIGQAFRLVEQPEHDPIATV